MKDEIHQLLDQKVKQYNHFEFIDKDPIYIPHLFTWGSCEVALARFDLNETLFGQDERRQMSAHDAGGI